MSKLLFQPCNILLPKTDSYEKWSVIACDQFTSEPQYWEQTRSKIGVCKSALDLILPEAYLSEDNSEKICAIHDSMNRYLSEDSFQIIKNSFIYVERTLLNGDIRPGLIGVIDLEDYSFEKGAESRIRPTEKTVVERIPPRKMVRENAPIEMPHIILFYNDEEDRFTSYIQDRKEALKKVYDFDLIMGGGHISGWAIQGDDVEKIKELFSAYQTTVEDECSKHRLNPMILAVGDGNHSLATAKACWEDLKKKLPKEQWDNHPARYAMVEIENIYDKSLQFEPIHRIVQNTNTDALLEYLKNTVCCECGHPIKWHRQNESGCLYLNVHDGELPLAVFQDALDKWLAENPGEVDYIHGEQSLLKLAEQEDAIGFLMPEIEKGQFFIDIMKTGVLPRKTFSLGHAEEKRYYLEARRIL